MYVFYQTIHRCYNLIISGQNNKDIYYANLKINVYGQKRENKEKASYYNELLLKTMLDYPTDSRWCYYYFRDNYSQINLNQMFEYSCKSIFKRGNIVSENNFISNYFSVHIIMFILSKMIDENNYILCKRPITRYIEKGSKALSTLEPFSIYTLS